MAKDITIYRKRCRWYSAGYLWVSDDGLLAVVSDKGNKFNPTGKKKVTIRSDPSGRRYVKHPYGHTVYIDEAVITCFCPPPPKNGKKHEIHHKDGKLNNCHYKNLEWTEYHYHHATTKSVALLKQDVTITVSDDGEIKLSGKKVNNYDEIFDSDTNLTKAVLPFITTPDNKRLFIEDLMKDAGFIHGDDAGLKRPVVLHKDNDYKNCNSGNLEFVEADDPKYVAYEKQRDTDLHNRNVELNPGKKLPPNW